MGVDLLHGYLAEKLEDVLRVNHEIIKQTAAAISDGHLNKHRIYGFGSGHSAPLIEEMHYRAGELNLVRPLSDFGAMFHHDPLAASQRERTLGYSQKLLARADFDAGDVLWLIFNVGRNAIVIEMAWSVKAQGIQVIAFTSLNHCQSVEPLGLPHVKLYHVADLVLENRGTIGDAGIWVTELPAPMIPTSTILGAVVVHAAWMPVAEKLVAAGLVPDVGRSFNLAYSIPGQVGSVR